MPGMVAAGPGTGNLFPRYRRGYCEVTGPTWRCEMRAVFGLIAIAILLALVGLAYTAVKWLLIVAAVIFLLGVLRAFVSARGGTTRGGPDVRSGQ
jgi:hypothetical protein